jgi:uncharacterized repeat protein (TIGR01451 family)
LTVNAFAAGKYRSTTEVRSSETDVNLKNNSLTTINTVEAARLGRADLELTQTVSNAKPQIGEQVTLMLTLANKGPGIASGIRVRDRLPRWLTFVNTVAEQGTYNPRSGVWEVGNLREISAGV